MAGKSLIKIEIENINKELAGNFFGNFELSFLC